MKEEAGETESAEKTGEIGEVGEIRETETSHKADDSAEIPSTSLT